MDIRIYGIKNCNTMKKTFAFLDEKKVDYQFVDYKKQEPDPNLMVRFADKVGFENLINKRGTTYRKLTDDEKNQLESEKSALALLSQKSSMIKRPIVEFPDGDLVVGFDPEEIESKLK